VQDTTNTAGVPSAPSLSQTPSACLQQLWDPPLSSTLPMCPPDPAKPLAPWPCCAAELTPASCDLLWAAGVPMPCLPTCTCKPAPS
jgi:hypothetical protein